MCLAIEFYEYLVEVPTPIRVATVLVDVPFPELSREDRINPVSPEPHRLMSDVNAGLKQKILHFPQLKRIADVQHYRDAVHLWRAVKISQWIAYPPQTTEPIDCLKPICPNNVPEGFVPMDRNQLCTNSITGARSAVFSARD